MMLDIFIGSILIILLLFPSLLKPMNTVIGKSILLLCIYFIGQQNLILGIIAGIIFIYNLSSSFESFSPKSNIPLKHSLLPLDENIRAKDSNKIKVSRDNISPSTEEISGSIPGNVSNNNTGSYTQINM
jgi:hypothetical protein